MEQHWYFSSTRTVEGPHLTWGQAIIWECERCQVLVILGWISGNITLSKKRAEFLGIMRLPYSSMLVEWTTVMTSNVQKYPFLVTDWQEKGKNGTEWHWSQHRLVHFVQSPCIREACAYFREQNMHPSPQPTLHLPFKTSSACWWHLGG